MAWETVEKRIGRGTYRPREWSEVPCVSILKTGLSFNKAFSDAYGVRAGSWLSVLVDREHHKIGFKVSEQDNHTFRVTGRKDDGKSSDTTYLSCKALCVQFPDRKGMVFRAMLNNGERVIEVDLDKPLS